MFLFFILIFFTYWFSKAFNVNQIPEWGRRGGFMILTSELGPASPAWTPELWNWINGDRPPTGRNEEDEDAANIGLNAQLISCCTKLEEVGVPKNNCIPVSDRAVVAASGVKKSRLAVAGLSPPPPGNRSSSTKLEVVGGLRRPILNWSHPSSVLEEGCWLKVLVVESSSSAMGGWRAIR